ncbi:HAMP domain-containing sensor histidine kinase [Sulfurovum sp. AR]|uniref:HAMP domain-containing sensor histidine kinase n=1 Tax=Sulfurovum sp. AR TaxID=1165841 RepID=UPI00031E3FBD|nr:HAMP domain-containing sensor histidine kinase [Sulfurovum sp. AR]
MYSNFQQQNQNNLNDKLTQSIHVNRLLLSSAVNDSYQTFEEKKTFFTRIHQKTIDEFKKDENISLVQLRNKIVSLFQLNDVKVDIYVINKEYVITDATFEKDIGLDFKNIFGGKKYFDNISRDNDIHIENDLLIDYMDESIKVYSCASLNHDKYLQMSFADPFIYKKLRQTVENISKSTQNKINLFRITKTPSNEEYYENILNDETIINKEEYLNLQKKFPINRVTDDAIINANRQNKIIRSDKNIAKNLLTFYIPIFSKKKEGSSLDRNFIMKMDIDISEYLNQQQKNKNIFILLGIVLFTLIGILYNFIKNHFYFPITKITQNFKDNITINDPDLLSKKDEFGTLANEYNTLYSKLQNQVENNQHLLNENKQFIADMVHQIRTPLTVIMTNASLIEMQTQDQVSSYIKQINSAINMLSNSYEDLAYGITNDTIEYKPSEIDISKLLHERIDFFEVIAEANEKTIVTDIAMDIHLYMNDIELERLIDNNLSNAIKHSHDKSKIKIILEKINSEVLLQFISEGKHIYDVSKIFDKNYTESYGAKRSLGLGLNMVKTICEKNNIYYAVNSINHMNTFTYIFKG